MVKSELCCCTYKEIVHGEDEIVLGVINSVYRKNCYRYFALKDFVSLMRLCMGMGFLVG